MNKELELLEKSKNMMIENNGDFIAFECLKVYSVCKQALQRLESIDNAKPSEALECLYYLKAEFRNYPSAFDCIKQTLLKAQENKKVLEIIKEKPMESGIAINNIKKQRDYSQYKKTIYDLSQIYLLTEEEFDLLKRWLG